MQRIRGSRLVHFYARRPHSADPALFISNAPHFKATPMLTLAHTVMLVKIHDRGSASAFCWSPKTRTTGAAMDRRCYRRCARCVKARCAVFGTSLSWN